MNESTLGEAGKVGVDDDHDHEDERTSVMRGRSTSATIITKLQPDDVLMGRGSNIMLHQGNVRFIEIIRSRCAEYQSISSRKQKHIIAQQIVSTVRSRQGLFLRKIESSSLSSSAAAADEAAPNQLTDEHAVPSNNTRAEQHKAMWTLVDERDILLKVKQALRDQSLIMMSKNISDGKEGIRQQQQQHHRPTDLPNKGPIKKRAGRAVGAKKQVAPDGLR